MSVYFTIFGPGYHQSMQDQLIFNDSTLKEAIHVGTLESVHKHGDSLVSVQLTPYFGNVKLLFEEDIFDTLTHSNVPIKTLFSKSKNFELVEVKEIHIRDTYFRDEIKEYEKSFYALISYSLDSYTVFFFKKKELQ